MHIKLGPEFDIPNNKEPNSPSKGHYQDIKDVLEQIGSVKPERYVNQVSRMIDVTRTLPVQLRDGSSLRNHSDGTILHFLGTNLSTLEPGHLEQLWHAMKGESSSRSSSTSNQDLSDSFERSSTDEETQIQKPSGWKEIAKEWLSWGRDQAKSWLTWGKGSGVSTATKKPSTFEDI